jgi:hypothetical protein
MAAIAMGAVASNERRGVMGAALCPVSTMGRVIPLQWRGGRRQPDGVVARNEGHVGRQCTLTGLPGYFIDSQWQTCLMWVGAGSRLVQHQTGLFH